MKSIGKLGGQNKVPRISNDRNIDLSSINGSGPNGRIIKRDLENIDKSEIEFFSSSEYKIIEPSNIRKIIAKRTTQTKNTIPHFYLSVTSKVDKLLKLRQKINESNNKTKVSINDLLVKALAIAQSKNPKSNVYWHNEKIIQYLDEDFTTFMEFLDRLLKFFSVDPFCIYAALARNSREFVDEILPGLYSLKKTYPTCAKMVAKVDSIILTLIDFKESTEDIIRQKSKTRNCAFRKYKSKEI